MGEEQNNNEQNNNDSAAGAGAGGGDEFTPITSQDEFNKAVAKRIERERGKYADYDDLKNRVSQFEKDKRAAMTDAERAIAEAETRGRAAASSELGQRLARTQFDALAGRRNADVDTNKVLEYVDLSKFIDDNGQPDEAAIKSAVERLVPEPAAGPPSFDGGSRRTAAGPKDMNSLIRGAAGAR
jgi:hypothetical protein